MKIPFLTCVTVGGSLLAAMAATLAAPATAAPVGHPVPHPSWVTAWLASSTQSSADAADCPAYTGLADQTIRTVLTTSTGGDEVRIRLSNAFGTAALRVGHASIAVRGSGADTVA